jgi:hypothetical protein
MNKSIHFLIILSIIAVANYSATAQKSGKYTINASIAGISKGEISKSLLLSNGVIKCSDPKAEILYFSLSAFMKNGDLIVYNGEGNVLTESMKIIIDELEKGSKLIIENIAARTTGDKVIQLPSIVLILH